MRDGLFKSQMLWAALDALAQSYDYLVIDAGAQSRDARWRRSRRPRPMRSWSPATRQANAIDGARAASCRRRASREVAVLTGPPPALERGARRNRAA